MVTDRSRDLTLALAGFVSECPRCVRDNKPFPGCDECDSGYIAPLKAWRVRCPEECYNGWVNADKPSVCPRCSGRGWVPREVRLDDMILAAADSGGRGHMQNVYDAFAGGALPHLPDRAAALLAGREAAQLVLAKWLGVELDKIGAV